MNCCRSSIVIAAVSIGWWCVCPVHGQAQTPATEASPATTADAPAPDPISAGDFASESARVEVQLDRIEVAVQADPLLTRLATELTQQTETVVNLRTELDDLNVVRATPRRLDEQRRRWNELAEQVDEWRLRADDRWKSLQQSREELRLLRQRWELTRDRAEAEELPADMTQRVQQVLTRIESVQAENRQRIDQVAEFVDRLTQMRLSISDASKRLADLSGQATLRLRYRDSPPLWQTQQAEWLRLDDSTVQGLKESRADVASFVSNQWGRLLVQLTLFVALALAATKASRASRDWPPEEAEYSAAKQLLRRPYSLALGFAILAAIPLYPSLPAVVRDAFYLLLLIPILRLASGQTNTSGRIALYGMLGLSAFYQMVPLSPEGSLLMRLTLLLCDLAAIAVASWVLWREWPRKDGQRTWSRVALLFACVAAQAIFAISFLADVLGWVNLSHFLTNSMLLTLQGALFAVVLVRAAAGLLPPLLRLGPGSSLRSVRRYPGTFERVAVSALAILLFFYWLEQTLRRFRLSDPVHQRIDAILTTPMSWAEMAVTAGDVLKALVIVVVTLVAQRVASFFLREEFFPRLHMRTSSAAVLATLLKYTMVAVGLSMAGSALGFSATQLTVLFGALGVGIGFGLQSIVNNFVSGLILLLERPVKIGDVVELGGNVGVVSKVGVRATIVESFEGSEIIVPNADLITREVKNWTLSGTAARIELIIGTEYDSDPRDVLKILTEVAGQHDRVSSVPAPSSALIEFAPAAIKYRLTCYTNINSRATVAGELHVAVYEALAKAGIGSPFPNRASVESSTASIGEASDTAMN